MCKEKQSLQKTNLAGHSVQENLPGHPNSRKRPRSAIKAPLPMRVEPYGGFSISFRHTQEASRQMQRSRSFFGPPEFESRKMGNMRRGEDFLYKRGAVPGAYF